jgi:hypothetical protein
MFDVAERGRVRQRLLERADTDPDVVAAAITGSLASGDEDRWSDLDLAFGIDSEVQQAVERWVGTLYGDFGALHHWDHPVGSTLYVVFLLPDCLELDLSFTPAADFGPHGPNWQLLFGEAGRAAPTPPADRDHLIGLGWHHLLHARASIERGKPWHAEWWISGLRDQTSALACLRLGKPTEYARGADSLPAEIKVALEAALVRSLDEPELRRALNAAASAFREELERTDASLAARLLPTLAESIPA